MFAASHTRTSVPGSRPTAKGARVTRRHCGGRSLTAFCHLPIARRNRAGYAVVMRYLVVVEKSPRNYSAYSPDVSGCIATGRTLDETIENMRDALEGHLEVMADHGDPTPEPTAWTITAHGYVVPVEKTADGYRAEPPDLPDVATAADTPERVEAVVRDAIAQHLNAQQGRAQFPEPAAEAVYVEIAVPSATTAS